MKKQPGKRRSPVPSSAMLDEMIEEATVDAYGSSEQITGFYTMLDEHLAVPFKTEVLGVEATVTRVDVTTDEQIVAVCVRGRSSAFRSSTCRCPIRPPLARNGSTLIAVGRAEANLARPPSLPATCAYRFCDTVEAAPCRRNGVISGSDTWPSHQCPD